MTEPNESPPGRPDHDWKRSAIALSLVVFPVTCVVGVLALSKPMPALQRVLGSIALLLVASASVAAGVFAGRLTGRQR